MKALILVGGFGTRLRPLTLSKPKPLVEFANIPIVVHQIAALAEVGVKEVILAINQLQPQIMEDYMKEVQQKYSIKVTYSIEHEPMGTAGPLKLAEQIIRKDNEEGLFFVLNSDITCDFPLKELIAFHKNHGKEGTILLTRVKEPSKYGVVLHDEKQQILDFIEKPQQFISDKINAGLYIFKTSIIDRVEMKPTSIEKEVFPRMAKEGELFCFDLQGFWMDIGQPKDYLSGQKMYLDHQQKVNQSLLATGDNIKGNVVVHQTASVDKEALIGPNVVIGANVKVAKGARVLNSAVFEGSQIKEHSYVEGSILGWKNKVGKWSRVQGLSIFGEDVEIKDEVMVNATIVLPHKAIGANQEEKGKIVM